VIDDNQTAILGYSVDGGRFLPQFYLNPTLKPIPPLIFHLNEPLRTLFDPSLNIDAFCSSYAEMKTYNLLGTGVSLTSTGWTFFEEVTRERVQP